MKALILMTMFTALPARAAHMPGQIFFCKVASFDEKEIKAACDPKKEKELLRIPRDWVELGEDLKVGKIVVVPLEPPQIKKWLTMNAKVLKEGRK